MSKTKNRVTVISTATTTQVKSGPCVLKRIVFNKPVSAGSVALCDATAGTTATHGTIISTADLKPFVLELNYRFSTGLRIVTVEAQEISVVWEPA